MRLRVSLCPLGYEFKFSKTIQNLIGPETLQPVQRLVQGGELLVGDAADLLYGLDVLLVQRVDDVADFLALRGEADAYRAAVDARALVIEGAELVATGAQLAGGQFLVADVVQQQRLNRIDIGAAAAVELVLDDIEQTAMQALHQGQG